MKSDIKTEKMDVVILCGGRGERLKHLLNGRSKPMLEINGRPFLDILIDYIASFGFRRFVLCTGYKAHLIRNYYSNKKGRGIIILFSEEKYPLGTAGALRNAQPFVKSSHFLLFNGDSICRLDLCDFVAFHKYKKALFSAVFTRPQSNSDCGFAGLDACGKIVQFNERLKTKNRCFVNAGIYIFEKSVFSFIVPKVNVSLEYNILPQLVNKRFYGYVTKEKLVDIGVPERYIMAQTALRDL